jgi:hypothetical protein
MMKKQGHYCHVCGRHRANEKFSGKGHAKHICKDCDREHRAKLRERKRALDSRVVFVQVLARPERKLMVKRAVKANDYFAYCGEVGCGVWDELKAFPDACGEPLGLWMPPAMRPSGTSAYVQGVEVSAGYDGQTPEGFDMVALPAGWLMVFQGPPYDEGRFVEAIKVVQAAIRRFDPQVYGYEWADDDAPRVQWEPMGGRGYIEARPVRPGEKLGILHWI